MYYDTNIMIKYVFLAKQCIAHARLHGANSSSSLATKLGHRGISTSKVEVFKNINTNQHNL